MILLSVWSHVPSGGMMSLPVWFHVPSRGYDPRGGMVGGGALWSRGIQYTPPLQWYWHLVAAAKAGGTRPTRMHFC